MGKAATEQADKINNLSKVIGTSTQTLQKYTYAAELTGGGLDTVSESAQHLAKSLASAGAGNQQMQANFKAIGIGANELASILKNPDTALQRVAAHISQYKDSYDKAAIAQQLFGRGGAEQLPFLNKLGTSFGEVSDQAERFGLVLSDADQKALVGFKESSDQINQQLKGMATQFMVGLAPALKQANEQFSKVISPDLARSWGENVGAAVNKVIEWLGNMRTGFGEIAGFIDKFWIKISAGAQVDIAVLGYLWDSFAASTKNSLVDLYGYALKAANLLQNGPLTAPAVNDAIDEKLAGMKTAAPSLDGLNKQLQEIQKNTDAEIKAADMAIDSADNWAKGLDRVADSTEKVGDKTAKLPGDVAAMSAAVKRFNDDISNLTNLEDQLSSGLDGPYLGALKQYQKGLDLIDKTWEDAVAAGKNTDALWNRLVTDSERLGQQLDQTNKHIKEQHDAFAQVNQELQLQQVLMQTAPQDQAAVTAGFNAYNAALKANVDLYGDAIQAGQDIKDVLKSQLPAYIAAKQKVEDLNQAMKLNADAAKEWQGIWKTAGDGIADTFSKVLVEGGSLMKGLKDIAKQTVEAIISYFIKLSVINPILNSIFGGQTGYGMLPTGGNAMGGGVGLFQLFGSGGGGAAGGAGGVGSTGGSLFSADTWASAGKTLFSGFQSAWTSAGNMWSSVTGAETYDGGVMNLPGDTVNPIMSTPAGAGYGGYGSALGQGIGIAGGVFAGYNEFKNAGGGLNGAAGGLAYGAGTYFAGAAISAGLSGGLAAGLAAVPVVGWIAIGAMVLDKLTGGGLFGTAWKPTGNTGLNVSTSASGINADASAEEKRKKALFQGSQTKTVTIDVPAETLKQLQDFFKTLDQGVKDFVGQFKDIGNIAAGVLDSTFKQTFDKKGNVTSTSETIAGVAYQDTDAQSYMKRLQALTFIKALDDMGLAASKFVDGAQADVDALLAQVQDFAGATQEANTNLGAGFKFMALSANQSLKDVMTFVEGLKLSGETLTAAYERLAAAQQQYDQFVAQFKPPTQYVDPFEAAIAGLNDQLKAAIAQANAMAKAAGAAGASQEDLTNILKYYQAQMAAATAQLQASAQSLAFSLGLTTQGTLDQVNQEIQDLTGGASDAASSVSNFGGAIAKVAQQASDAMNLLLGDLSPLNDQQKLQTALQGLQAGTVTKDQVLEIGRRLYASSEAYNALFKQVMAMQSKGQGGGGNGGSSSSGGKQLSAADQQKLADLYKQRDMLQAAQTLSQFQQFAQQVAELATAKGEDFTQVLSEMGVKQSDLEKGLNLKDDTALRAYVEGFQKQMDSAGENTASIVAAVNALPNEIAMAIGATSVQNQALLNRFNGGGDAGSVDPVTGLPVDPVTGRPLSGQPYTPPAPSQTAVGNASNMTPTGTGQAVAGGGTYVPLDTQIERGVTRAVAPLVARIDASTRRNIRWRQNA
jgi:hypothetical protein